MKAALFLDLAAEKASWRRGLKGAVAVAERGGAEFGVGWWRGVRVGFCVASDLCLRLPLSRNVASTIDSTLSSAAVACNQLGSVASNSQLCSPVATVAA
jgi:hypothetical protein